MNIFNEDTTKIIHALNSSTRRAILILLYEKERVEICDILKELHLERQAFIYNVKTLTNTRLVYNILDRKCEGNGIDSYYTLTEQGKHIIHIILTKFQ